MLASLLSVNMAPRLKISNRVVERLEKAGPGVSGKLYGICDESSTLVLGLSVSGLSGDHTKDVVDLVETFNGQLVRSLPAGVTVRGWFSVTDGEGQSEADGKVLGDGVECPVVLSFNREAKKLKAAYYKNGALDSVDFTTVDDKELTKSHLHLRLTATFPVNCDLDSSSVESTLDDLEEKVLGGNVAFQFGDSNVYLLGDKDGDVSGLSPKSTLTDLVKSLGDGKSREDGKLVVLNVGLYLNNTVSENLPRAAPCLKYVKKNYKHGEIQFSLDSLAVASKTAQVVRLYPLLVEAARRNFALNRANLLDQLAKQKVYNVCSPETYHFLPTSLGHFFTIVYSSKGTVDDSKRVREAYHLLLSLPMDRPVFRQANAYDFVDEVKTDPGRPLNPHESVGPSGVADGDPQFVQGTYAYYHYMQDNFDDNGWGCAYRSLQTIFSWFRFQGYTNVPVPTHKEIQQCLVKIGDKPGSFAGSKQWIGSTEVSFVLDTLLGVSSRIVSVSSGEEMTMKGGELSYHFRTQGTPVMIGGGVLAHTILGVDYNKNTGDIRFLILDPHYTGQDDMSVILRKGWCGWKGPDFWKKDAFYNMCMPLKPKCV